MMLGVLGNWMGRSAWKWGLLALGLVFLSSEQTIISAPILLLAAAWVGLASGAEAGRSWRWQACFYSAWTGVSAAIFFLSPGQRLRNTFLTMKPLGEFDLLEWYRQAVALGYGAIFPRLPDALWLWHLILYGALGLLAAAWIIRRRPRAAPYHPAGDPAAPKPAGIALMAFAFLTAFLASMATLAVSPYFPPYAVCFPSLLLLLGLVFAFWLVLDGAAIGLERATASARRAGVKKAIGVLKLACAAGLPLLAAGALIGTVTVRSWPVMAAEYRQVMAQNHNRRQLYAEIARLRKVSGQTHFVLVNLWQAPVWGIHMDEVWAVAAYFRWRRMEDVVCLTEEEWIAGGRPQEQLYLKLDCARVLAAQ